MSERTVGPPQNETEQAEQSVHVEQSTLDKLEQLIREKMPITEHLGFSLSWQEGRLAAHAPLAPNCNHAGSAFGGSLSMLATLTGWATVHLALHEMKEAAQVVIQRHCIEYLQPIREDFFITCPWPDEHALQCFRETLQRWGCARLSVCCEAGGTGKDGAATLTYRAQYVALRDEACADSAP